jgi:hypothetical protein
MKKIKQFLESEKGKDLLIVIVIIIVGLGSFLLGRLSIKNDLGGIKRENPGLNTEQDNNLTQPDNTTQTNSKILNANTISSGKTFFASNRGSKYYTTTCSAGKTIKQENRVYFTTGKEAEAAGYTLSSSCN